MKAPPWPLRRQYIAFGLIAAVAILLTAIQSAPSRGHYDGYFAGMPPVLVVSGSVAVAAAALTFLRSAAGYQILRGRATLRGIAVSAGYASILAAVIVIADLIIRYPEDINVPVPQAFLFYPTIGFVAEVVFHLLPLAVVLSALSLLRQRLGVEPIIRIAMVITAVSEPTFQILFAGEVPTWASAYTWLHVFAIAFLQLKVFRRYDFASMIAFRMIYYLYWHIIWGTLRLTVMF